jgi:alkylation response protein AidB-like acyl-CoA dehydrogenase
MNFDFTDEQKTIQMEARRFLEGVCPPSRVREAMRPEVMGHDPGLWAEIAAQGWLGAALPTRYGGLGLGYLELCLFAEEIGRVLAPIPIASTLYLVAEALLIAGSESQKERLLPQICSGSLLAALAISEGAGPLVPGASTTTTMTVRGEITGVKEPVTDGGIADLYLVLALEDGAPDLFLVERTDNCVDVQSLRSLDPTRNIATVKFSGARAERLGEPGSGIATLTDLLDRAAVLVAFEQVGGADRCLELARDYALHRFAFGRQVGAYQAIKHKLADIYVANQLARSHAYFGAWALAANAPELATAASAARVSATEAYWLASKENIHVHGGMGFTWEADCHLFYRRAAQLSLLLGPASRWRERLISRLETTLSD